MNKLDFFIENLQVLWEYTGFGNVEIGNVIMTIVGCLFIYLAIAKHFEPMLLVPIGFGILVGNIPFPLDAGLRIGIYEEGSVLNILYSGVKQGWYPPLIFLGIGAMTDFSALIANPKMVLVGAAAQFGIFGAYMLSLALGFSPQEAGAIGIIGGADGPTAIFLSSKLAPDLMGAIAVAAYSYMALIPVFQRDEASYHRQGTSHPHEGTWFGEPAPEDHLPDSGPASHHVDHSFRSSTAGYAVLWKPAQGVGCHPSPG